MKAIEIRGRGGPEVLCEVEIATPTVGDGEVLIAVKAAGVNRPDVLQRKGLYPPPPGASPLPGLEVAGEIVAVGTEVTQFREGDAVCALVAGGGYAQYCAAPALQCLPKPDSLSFEEAACLPEALFTVWDNVFGRAGFSSGETVLIHGAASGIGTTAIQLVKAFGGIALGTARGSEKSLACQNLGADLIIDSEAGNFAPAVLAATQGRGADIILDIVGGDFLMRNLHAASTDGRVVSIAFLRGSRAEIDLNLVMQKRLTVTGSTLRSRSLAEKGKIREQILERVWPTIATSRFKPRVYRSFALAEAGQAHALMESNQHVGKLVLNVS